MNIFIKNSILKAFFIVKPVFNKFKGRQSVKSNIDITLFSSLDALSTWFQRKKTYQTSINHKSDIYISSTIFLVLDKQIGKKKSPT